MIYFVLLLSINSVFIYRKSSIGPPVFISNCTFEEGMGGVNRVGGLLNLAKKMVPVLYKARRSKKLEVMQLRIKNKSCFLFPIPGEVLARQRFVSPRNGGRLRPQKFIHLFKNKFKRRTLKKIEECSVLITKVTIMYYYQQ